jgi:hypothetical protein
MIGKVASAAVPLHCVLSHEIASGSLLVWSFLCFVIMSLVSEYSISVVLPYPELVLKCLLQFPERPICWCVCANKKHAIR